MSIDVGLQLEIVWPALIAGALVLASHVPLGMQVLARGIVFIDLAVAQVAGVGVIAAELAGLHAQGWPGQAAALAAALAGAALLTWSERRRPQEQEALIGVLFVLASSLGMLLLAHHPHGGEHLQDLLAGQILWVGPTALWAMALVSMLVLILWWRLPQLREGFGFYALFALAVTASVQLVGVFLVFASLIMPALATAGMQRRRLAAAWGIGLAGYVVGLFGSSVFDLPAGPAVVWAMAACALAKATVGRR